ncbi:S4 domain-containing protein [Henriciella sp.]|uniref:S4 domain-containing protein n=1 Tax=Henriciella sp. TaxID=1968823 RepID=UPI002605F867|nr:S4 domain-containing protein [Henriciella sp.]
MSEEVRLDVWLWRSRFFKTRSIAASYISSRGVRVTRAGSTRKQNKPGARIVPGDIVSLTLGSHIMELRVISAGKRRGPATEARSLYERLDAGNEGDE